MCQCPQVHEMAHNRLASVEIWQHLPVGLVRCVISRPSPSHGSSIRTFNRSATVHNASLYDRVSSPKSTETTPHSESSLFHALTPLVSLHLHLHTSKQVPRANHVPRETLQRAVVTPFILIPSLSLALTCLPNLLSQAVCPPSLLDQPCRATLQWLCEPLGKPEARSGTSSELTRLGRGRPVLQGRLNYHT